MLITVQRDATQSSLFIILQIHSTCCGFQPDPLSGVHKTVTRASSTGHIFCAATSLQRGQASLSTLEGWVWLTPETCRVNMQNNKQTALCCISLDNYYYKLRGNPIIAPLLKLFRAICEKLGFKNRKHMRDLMFR